MYAMEIVPPQDWRHGDSSRTEGETLARGGRRFSRYSSLVREIVRILCRENPFWSRLFVSVTVTLFLYG